MANLSAALTTLALACAFLPAGIHASRNQTVPKSLHLLGTEEKSNSQNSLDKFVGDMGRKVSGRKDLRPSHSKARGEPPERHRQHQQHAR